MLLPEGIESIDRAPHDLVVAIEHASKVCDWQENLLSEEVPPSWMWPFDEELVEWFEAIDEKRKDRYGGGDDSSSGGDGMMSNELAKGRGR